MLEEKIRTVSECGGHCWQTNELGLARSDAFEWDENEDEEDGEDRESLESSCLDRVSLLYVYWGLVRTTYNNGVVPSE